MTDHRASDDTGFRQNAHDLGDDLATLKADAGAVVRDGVNTLRSGAAEIGDAACNAVGAAKEKFGDAKVMVGEKVDQAKHAVQQSTQNLKHSIARNPLASVSIAAGAGLLLGMLLARPRS